MSETIIQEMKTEVETEETTEIVEETEVVAEKPYTFRKLSSTDIFLMTTIISKIGINEFMACLEGDSLKSLVKKLVVKEDSKDGNKEDSKDDIYIMGAVAGTLEIANVIFRNLHKCEKEIYKLLEQTSNMTVEEITAEGNAVMFLEMVMDFLKKEEFPGFIKVVSAWFK